MSPTPLLSVLRVRPWAACGVLVWMLAAGPAWAQADGAGASGGAAVAGGAEGGATEAPEGETATLADGPHEVFEVARAAYNERDWPAFVECFSPAQRDELIGQLAVTLAVMAEQPEADPRVADLVERHVPEGLDPMELMMGSEDPEGELVRLAKRMREPMGFFAEAMSLIFSLEFGEDAEEVQLADLSDVVVDDEGLTAIGKVTVSLPEDQREDQWSFEKHEGDWYLSMK